MKEVCERQTKLSLWVEQLHGHRKQLKKKLRSSEETCAEKSTWEFSTTRKKFGERETKFIDDLLRPCCKQDIFHVPYEGDFLPTISFSRILCAVRKLRPFGSLRGNCNLQRLYLHLALEVKENVATGYGLDGWGSNPGRGKIFLFFTRSRPTLGPTQPPIRLVPGALKAVTAWSRPLTSILCGGKEWWSYTTTPPYAFMTQCLIN
jgi:hypothetical protein